MQYIRTVGRALQIAGLDVAIGSLHADQDGRASLVYDLMEPLWPVVDKIIFDWIYCNDGGGLIL